jgi:hypothetical protein
MVKGLEFIFEVKYKNDPNTDIKIDFGVQPENSEVEAES